ncbi:MAG: diacylglycerol kinase family lipid kinase [Chlorobi bacterium]|nr:diacylglycerol kinase family lipid kinase [Chlorobiota bacterium]
MEDKKNTWLVIVNPHAGSKKGERDWPEIRRLLKNAGIKTHCVFSERPYHAMEITRNHIEKKGFEKIIVVGGDGTLNEVINGIFMQRRIKTQDVTVGMISVGTGNDWGRMYEMPESYTEQVKLLTNGHKFLQDVGKATFRFSGDKQERYFINIAGMGYDALVAEKANIMKQKGKGGPVSYLVNVVSGLFQYKSVHLDIHADGKHLFSGKVFTMSIGICKYNGGGMMQLPDAVPDDGLLDITIIRKTTKYRIVTNIKNLYDGSFVKMREVEQFIGKKITVSSRPIHKLYLETDGESLGHSPLNFEVIPKAIRVMVKKSSNQKQNT